MLGGLAKWAAEIDDTALPRDRSVIDPAALDAHCLAEIARFKRPKHYITLGELPKNAYGKVLKTDLRARLAVR